MYSFHTVEQLSNTIQDSKNEGNKATYLETFKNGQKTPNMGQTRQTSSMARDQKSLDYSKTYKQIVCLEFYVLHEDFSLIWRRHHYR